MKLKYIFAALVAVCSLAIGCTKETPTVLDEVQVSSSYVGLSNNDGNNSATIKVTAKDSWSINAIPEWVSISPMSGNAGETTVTFSADKASGTRENTIKITCAGKEQTIIIRQEAEKVIPKTITVAEALKVIEEYPDGSPVNRVKGIVCKITEISPSYGNATFYISDDGKFEEGKWLQVYRGLWMNGAAFTKGDEFTVGDELVIEGVLMSYKGTPETKEKAAYVIEINKSLIKVDSLSINDRQFDFVPVEGGEVVANLSCKGNGISVNVPVEAQSWISVTGIDTGKGKVNFNIAPNQGGDRSATLTFATTDGQKDYTASATISQKGAIIECTAAEFNAAPVGETQYRVTGVVTEIANAGYGNIYVKDWSGEVYVYGVGAKGDFEKTGVKVGDIVTVVGKRAEYKGTIEMTGVSAFEAVTSVKEATIAEFNAAPDSKTDYYMVTGTITTIDNTTYGNLHMAAGGSEVYVYGCYPGYGASGDNRKNFIETAGIKVGDTLTMIGYKDTYNGTIELCGGIYFSHETPAAE